MHVGIECRSAAKAQPDLLDFLKEACVLLHELGLLQYLPPMTTNISRILIISDVVEPEIEALLICSNFLFVCLFLPQKHVVL